VTIQFALRRRQAFSLVEIMIIVAIIGLLAALVIPSLIKVRKQSQGKRVVNDARIIDAAINAWAINHGYFTLRQNAPEFSNVVAQG